MDKRVVLVLLTRIGRNPTGESHRFALFCLSIVTRPRTFVNCFFVFFTEINFVGAVTRGKPFSGGKRVIPRTPFLKPLDLREVCFQKT